MKCKTTKECRIEIKEFMNILGFKGTLLDVFDDGDVNYPPKDIIILYEVDENEKK